MKEILRPTLLKVVLFLFTLVIFYFLFLNTIRVNYECTAGGAECVRETQQITQQLVTKSVIGFGLPVALLVYIVTGVISSKRKRLP